MNLPAGVTYATHPDHFPLFELDADTLSVNLRAWRIIMGTEWWGTPGTAAVNALEARIKGTRTWHGVWRLAAGPFDRANEGRYRASTFDRRADCKESFLHGYDVTRMDATAAGTTEVCPWQLRRGPREFDKSLAGWWKADISPWCWPELPDPAGYPGHRHRPGTARWVTTPTLKLLGQLHDEGAHGGFEILESWVGKGRPIFKEWNQGLERLYREGPPAMQATVKAAGRQAIGLLNSRTHSTYRPDWHYAVIAQGRSNVFRKVWKEYGTSSRAPLAIDTDCVWYGSDDEDPMVMPPAVFQFGDTPGALKVTGTVAV